MFISLDIILLGWIKRNRGKKILLEGLIKDEWESMERRGRIAVRVGI